MTNQTKAGRPATMTAILIAGTSSACLNVWGASQLFDGPAALVFATGILAMEGIALLSMAHILQDWQNNHRAKAMLAGLIFAFAVFGCAMSGHRAFHTLAVQSEMTNVERAAKAERLRAQAADGFERAAFAAEKGNTNGEWRETEKAESALTEAAALEAAVKTSEPPSALVVLVLLALFELVKTAGRYAIATETSRTWSPKQRAANDEKKTRSGLKKRIPRHNPENVVAMFAAK